MGVFQNMDPLTILLILGGLVIGWVLLRVLLKFTVRVFACGCLVLVLVGGGAYLLTALVG